MSADPNTQKVIVALCGCKRVGKDTVADHLVNNHGFVKRSIANPLKEMCRQAFGLCDDDVHSDAKDVPNAKLFGKTPRDVLQYVGTELMQLKLQEFMPEMGRNVWINKTIHDMTTDEGHDKFVISDVRFPHELAALRNASGFRDLISVKIERAGIDRGSHVAENSLQGVETDYTIHNDATIDELIESVEKIMMLKSDPLPMKSGTT